MSLNGLGIFAHFIQVIKKSSLCYYLLGGRRLFKSSDGQAWNPEREWWNGTEQNELEATPPMRFFYPAFPSRLLAQCAHKLVFVLLL